MHTAQNVDVSQHGFADDFQLTFATSFWERIKNKHTLTGQKMRRRFSAHPRGKSTRSVPAQRGSTEAPKVVVPRATALQMRYKFAMLCKPALTLN